MSCDFELTDEERRAVESLRRLGRRWPGTLWLFSASGSLCVMRKGADGTTVMTSSGGVDPEYEVCRVEGIDNDGGDW